MNDASAIVETLEGMHVAAALAALRNVADVEVSAPDDWTPEEVTVTLSDETPDYTADVLAIHGYRYRRATVTDGKPTITFVRDETVERQARTLDEMLAGHDLNEVIDPSSLPSA